MRLLEAMRLGIAPVILSDDWIPFVGPEWKRFAVWVPMYRYPELPRILESLGEGWRERGAAAREEWERLARPGARAELILDALEALRARHRPGGLLDQVTTRLELFLDRVGRPSARHLLPRLLGMRAIDHTPELPPTT